MTKYEIICGHRRCYAAKKLGIEKVPVNIVDYDDDTAIKAMISSNLDQRKKIKPSVKAKAYKMFLEVNKRQGKRTDLTSNQAEQQLEAGNKASDSTSGPVVQKLRTHEKAAEEFGESTKTIQRYAKLTDLLAEILELVDNEEIKVGPAVEIAYLSGKAQEILYSVMKATSYRPSLEDAKAFRKMSEEKLTIKLPIQLRAKLTRSCELMKRQLKNLAKV